jgi:hypothetical protein
MRYLVLIGLFFALTQTSCVAMTSEHYSLDSFSYGEFARASMSSDHFTFSDIGEDIDLSSSGGVGGRRIRGQVSGIASSSYIAVSQTIPEGFSTSRIVSIYQPGLVEGIATIDISDVDQTQSDSQAVLYTSGSAPTSEHAVKRVFDLQTNRIFVLCAILGILWYVRSRTSIGKKWTPF